MRKHKCRSSVLFNNVLLGHWVAQRNKWSWSQLLKNEGIHLCGNCLSLKRWRLNSGPPPPLPHPLSMKGCFCSLLFSPAFISLSLSVQRLFVFLRTSLLLIPNKQIDASFPKPKVYINDKIRMASEMLKSHNQWNFILAGPMLELLRKIFLESC